MVRVAPESVSISDPDAIRDLYITSGGLIKDSRYENFNLGPIASIFSAIDTDYRDARAKAVAPLFATGRLREASSHGGTIAESIEEFIEQLKSFKAAKLKMDLLDLCARVSIDVVTGYLLGERYGGLAEHASLDDLKARQETKLSANHFIFAIVAWSRFSLLPHWLFMRVYPIYSRLVSSEEVTKSFIKLDRFTQKVIGNISEPKSSSTPLAQKATSYYHGRLLQAGVLHDETSAQAKAIVFAGTDSTAVMLTTILFHLTRNTKARAHVLAEIRQSDTSVDPRTLPYLHAVVREGLRLGMANPTRLTRVVSANEAGGLRIGSVLLPPGTVAGCAAYTLHHDPEVFPEPFAFRPERWLTDGRDAGLKRPRMEKSILAFGAGTRACIGKNLALEQLYHTVRAVVDAEVLEGARTCQERIELNEWFNGEIKGHHLDIEWS